MNRTAKKCSLCETILIYHPPTKQGCKDYFWRCPDCGAEVWPEILSVRRQIKTGENMKAKKKTGGSGRKKRKVKKPGEKFIPWYQRYSGN